MSFNNTVRNAVDQLRIAMVQSARAENTHVKRLQHAIECIRDSTSDVWVVRMCELALLPYVECKCGKRNALELSLCAACGHELSEFINK